MPEEFQLDEALLKRCAERAPVYDRENRFCQEDFDELKEAGYMLMAVPEEFGGAGRDITATIASFREVDFSTAGIGFILSMNPGALAGAPHSFISTVYAEPEAEAAILPPSDPPTPPADLLAATRSLYDPTATALIAQRTGAAQASCRTVSLPGSTSGW